MWTPAERRETRDERQKQKQKQKNKMEDTAAAVAQQNGVVCKVDSTPLLNLDGGDLRDLEGTWYGIPTLGRR